MNNNVENIKPPKPLDESVMEPAQEAANRKLIESMWVAHCLGFRVAYLKEFGIDLEDHVTWAHISGQMGGRKDVRNAFLGRLARLPGND